MKRQPTISKPAPPKSLLHTRATAALSAKIRAAAKQNKRSVSEEIAFMLEAAYAEKEQAK